MEPMEPPLDPPLTDSPEMKWKQPTLLIHFLPLPLKFCLDQIQFPSQGGFHSNTFTCDKKLRQFFGIYKEENDNTEQTSLPPPAC